MTTLKEQLRTDLTTAMKARDKVRSSTLRMALTAVSTEEVAGSQARELSDDEVLTVLTREAKKRREAAQAYDDAGRPELAERERDELAVVEDYLPAPLTEDELRDIVAEAIGDAGAEGPRAMGQVMKALTPQVRGRVDGSALAAEVRRQLGA
jgi:uncharacterized protein YqeY